MSRARTSDTPSNDALDLVGVPDWQPADALVPPVAADDAKATPAPPCEEPPCEHLADQADFLLDAEGWEKWLEIVNSPPRDLPGLRAFLTKPVHCVTE